MVCGRKYVGVFMRVKTRVAGALAIAFSMVFFLREAWGQIREAQPDSAKVELMATYPNHSRQGVFPNPAIFPELGEWTYAAAATSATTARTWRRA